MFLDNQKQNIELKNRVKKKKKIEYLISNKDPFQGLMYLTGSFYLERASAL